MVPNWVIFGEIVCHVFLPYCQDMWKLFLYSIAQPIKSHIYWSGFFCLGVPFTMIFSAVLYFFTRFGGCGWPISVRAVQMDVYFCQSSSNPPNYDLVADTVTFLTIWTFTCIGPFFGGITVIGVFLLCFGPRENIHLLCCVSLVLIGRMHMNIFVW